MDEDSKSEASLYPRSSEEVCLIPESTQVSNIPSEINSSTVIPPPQPRLPPRNCETKNPQKGDKVDKAKAGCGCSDICESGSQTALLLDLLACINITKDFVCNLVSMCLAWLGDTCEEAKNCRDWLQRRYYNSDKGESEPDNTNARNSNQTPNRNSHRPEHPQTKKSLGTDQQVYQCYETDLKNNNLVRGPRISATKTGIIKLLREQTGGSHSTTIGNQNMKKRPQEARNTQVTQEELERYVGENLDTSPADSDSFVPQRRSDRDRRQSTERDGRSQNVTGRRNTNNRDQTLGFSDNLAHETRAGQPSHSRHHDERRSRSRSTRDQDHEHDEASRDNSSENIPETHRNDRTNRDRDSGCRRCSHLRDQLVVPETFSSSRSPIPNILNQNQANPPEPQFFIPLLNPTQALQSVQRAQYPYPSPQQPVQIQPLPQPRPYFNHPFTISNPNGHNLHPPDLPIQMDMNHTVNPNAQPIYVMQVVPRGYRQQVYEVNEGPSTGGISGFETDDERSLDDEDEVASERRRRRRRSRSSRTRSREEREARRGSTSRRDQDQEDSDASGLDSNRGHSSRRRSSDRRH